MTQGENTVGGATWSPDGKALAFFEAAHEHWQQLGRTFPGTTAPTVVSQVGRVDVANGARTALTNGPGRKLKPQWLPDGRIARSGTSFSRAARPRPEEDL